MSKKGMSVLCITFLIFCILFGFGCSSKEPGRYCNKDKYSIKFPKGWEKRDIDIRAAVGIDSITMTTPTEKPSEEPNAAITIVSQIIPAEANFELEKFVNEAVNFGNQKNIQEQDRSKVTIDGRNGYRSKAIIKREGNEIISVIYYLVNENSLYQIQSTIVSDPNDEYEDILEESINTFRFE